MSDLHSAFGPWNPGVQSEIPDVIRDRSTFLQRENVFTHPGAARELRDFTGLELSDVVAFRPERLALHELLIRVTADLSVPDGTRIEDLGINFRQITRTVLAREIAPRMADVTATYDGARRELSRIDRARGRHAVRGVGCAAGDARAPAIAIPLSWPARAHAVARCGCRPGPRRRRRMGRKGARHGRPAAGIGVPGVGARALRPAGPARPPVGQSGDARDAGHRHRVQRIRERRDRAAHRAMARRRCERGRLAPAAAQEQPVVMNTKGARPRARARCGRCSSRLAGEIGVDWSDFALISPDIWRKQLLDYGVARRRITNTPAHSPARNCRSSTRSSTATWRARRSAATCRIC